VQIPSPDPLSFSELPAILGGKDVLTSSTVREAYFLEYADGIRRRMKRTPLMVTLLLNF
jgi:hypothetical protein